VTLQLFALRHVNCRSFLLTYLLKHNVKPFKDQRRAPIHSDLVPANHCSIDKSRNCISDAFNSLNKPLRVLGTVLKVERVQLNSLPGILGVCFTPEMTSLTRVMRKTVSSGLWLLFSKRTSFT